MNKGFVGIILALLSLVLFIPCLCESSDIDLEKDLQRDLQQSKTVIEQISGKLKIGGQITNELTRLRTLSENIKASHLLLKERFKHREEEIKLKGGKASKRHGAMEEGYLKALADYLNLIESVQQSSTQQSAVSNQLQTQQTPQTLGTLKTLLDSILPKKKRPIFGSLPYRNLNYPSHEPSNAPPIKPAYKGGNKVVSPDDLKSTEEAPITEEIANLAQSLNWNPVLIYEYVKNNIETEWYWLCMKGAEETLRQKSGNDCDQAALFTALLRTSGFPTRYVRGTIEFFPDISSLKDNLGIDDPMKIAEFLQKAGIPFKPVIQGGKIANFQIERIWIESLIPYGNYRGAIIDDSEKIWLGLDTSLKVDGNIFNTPIDIFQQPGVSNQLSAIKDEYLGSVQSKTPFEYLETKLTADGYQLSDLLLTKTLVPEKLPILPLGTQFVAKKITDEYIEIPDELKHKVRFVASDPQSPTPEPLFDITFDTMELSNKQIALSYEPETVEDQEIIDSYGGLDNTPAYLVRLRPLLKVDGEMVVAGKDGLPMGEDHELTIELISPNGTEKTTNTHITGNPTAIAIAAQKAVSYQQSAINEDDDAETILFKEANRYIARWNEAEDELASLLHLNITRAIPTVVTVGGVIDVTYLLDMPHGYEWQGVFVDAGLRAIVVTPFRSPLTQGGSEEPKKTFMQLSALQGSILENRIFEDDFEVDSISTAKLFQTVGANAGSPFSTIDKTNINTILPTLDLADNIKEDITNAVNQNLTVKIPNQEISYKDWTGTGYIKENPSTGEGGYMLSGMIAGGMTALNKDAWTNQDLANKLSRPDSEESNEDPGAVVKLLRLNKAVSDYQVGIVGKALKTPYEVLAVDAKGRPVKNVSVIFDITVGGGSVEGVNKEGVVTGSRGVKITVLTGTDGIARARLQTSKKTADSPYYRMATNSKGETYWELVGLHMVNVYSEPASGVRISVDKPFEAYAKPDEARKIMKLQQDANGIYPGLYSGYLWIKVVDQYENSIANKEVKLEILPQKYLGSTSPPLSSAAKNAKIYTTPADCPQVATFECPKAMPNDLNPANPIIKNTEHFGAIAYVILGNTDNTEYTIKTTAKKDYFDDKGERRDTAEDLTDIIPQPPAEFKFYTGTGASDYLNLTAISRIGEKGQVIDVTPVGSEIPAWFEMFHIRENAPSGSRIFATTPVYNGTVNFKILESGVAGNGELVVASVGSVKPVSVTNNAAQQSNFYTTRWTLGVKPGINLLSASGSATIGGQSYYASAGAINNWGVEIEVDSEPMVVIDNIGYSVEDTEIRYSTLPINYVPNTTEVFFYEDDEYMGFVTGGSLSAVLSRGSAIFDSDKTYTFEVVLNRGTEAEIRSGRKFLKIRIESGCILEYDDTDGN